MRGRPRSLPLDKIRIDGDTQARAQLDEGAVADYGEAMRRGERFPPILVCNDGSDLWLADGFHRYHAARQAGQDALSAQVIPGTREDALWAALGANRLNGLRMTAADRQRSIGLALQSRPNASDRQVAEHIGVSHTTIAARRAELEADGQLAHAEKRRDSSGREQPARKRSKARSAASQAKREPAPPIPAAAAESPLPLLAAGLAHVEAAVAETAPEPGPDEQRPEPPPAPDAPLVDQLGRALPNAAIADDFARAAAMTALANNIRGLTDTVVAGISSHDPLYADIPADPFRAYAGRLVKWIEDARPHAVCPYCAGAGCASCHHRGWVNEYTYNLSQRGAGKTA